MPELTEDDAVAEINALQELVKTDGWKIFQAAVTQERDQKRTDALRAITQENREQARHQTNLLDDTIIDWAETRLKALKKIFEKIA